VVGVVRSVAGMDRARAASVLLVSTVVGVVALAGGGMYWGWQSSKAQQAEDSAAFSRAVLGSGSVGDVPPVWPVGMLVGVGAVCAVVALVVGLVLILTPATDGEPIA
jgi:hypothetical protein